MAIKNLRFELLEANLYIEIEAEDTMSFNAIILKLKTLEYLKEQVVYFIKTFSGIQVEPSSQVGKLKQSKFVITENKLWKSPAFNEELLEEVQEVSSELALIDNKYWILPFLKDAVWNNDHVQGNFFSIDNINSAGGGKISLNIVVQYSFEADTFSDQKISCGRSAKMKQILSDAFAVEFMVNSISEKNLFGNRDKLETKMQYYLTSHMEAVWGTKVENVYILSFREFASAGSPNL